MTPVLLVPTGVGDAAFFHASGCALESAIYLRFAPGDDVLVVPPLEIERAQAGASVARVVDWRDAGLVETQDRQTDLARVASRLLRERGLAAARIHPSLPVGMYLALLAESIALEVDREMLVSERRRKTDEQAMAIHAAQRAAEAACAEVIARIAVSEVRDGMLWSDGRPLTSEHLKGVASQLLTGLGYNPGELIIAGSPGSALPHERGEGHLAAGAPIVIDIFPSGARSHYHGDLTRTVVAGEIPDEVARMHAAVLQAFEAAVAMLRPGVDGRDVHRAACAALVEAGYGTATKGFEGPDGVAKMSHSLGHGIGLDAHEAPPLRDVPYLLADGDVVTVEPGLYLAGFAGVRVEDTVMITTGGHRNFTSLPRSLDPRAYL